MFLIEMPTKEKLARGLASWDWIDFSRLTPLAVSSFGDVFFDSGDSIVFLDTIEGKLTEVCGTQEHLEEIFSTEEGQDKYLLGGLVLSARESGLMLGAGECYHFKVEPIIGGAASVSNMTKMDFEIGLNILGQIHKQVKDLPIGAKITGVKLNES